MKDSKSKEDKNMDDLGKMKKQLAELEASLSKAKRVEKALRESERRYRKLIENITDTIFTLDDDWNFTFISPKFEKITGYSVQSLLWHPFFEILAPECSESFRERFISGTSEDITEAYEVDFIHKDGSRIHVELCIMPLLNDNKQSTGTILVAARNLTGRRQIAEEFLKAQKLESIGTLAGGIAHDFNNILTSILGNISLAKMYLESEKSSDKALERLNEAEEASIQAKSLTQRLLTFARGGAPIKKLLSLPELLKDTASLALSGSNVKCEFLISEDLCPVEADADQIKQAINNIIINAEESMPDGGIVKLYAENVKIEMENGLPLKSGNYVKITIEDHGLGIRKENLTKIFDPYFTTKQKNIGLGMATAYSIVKRHDGYITAESELGVGTKIHVYLPASTKKIMIEKTEIQEETKTIQEGPIHGKGKILVMDDEELIRSLLSEMLSNLGYEVKTAASGTETIGLFKEAKENGKPFDAILMDLTIPGGLGGKETIRKIKEIDPDVKAIVSSGYSNDPIMAEYEKYGFKAVIAKPYKINELSEILNKMLSE